MLSLPQNSIIDLADPVLITGARGFIGARLVNALQAVGFKDIRCLVRDSTITKAEENRPAVNWICGNLLNQDDCNRITRGVKLIYHLAAGTSSKSHADAFLNSVVTTRNLLSAAASNETIRRFVNVSSFSVYSNRGSPRRGLLDESCPIEKSPELREDAYCFAKVKQDELVERYGKEHGIPYVHVRPGVVYGPGKSPIHGRIGLGTFGIFLHLGGFNRIPFTFVENCAEAILLAGIIEGIDGHVFNVVDDDLPTSRRFLRLYKAQVRRFPSIFVPGIASYMLCWFWELFSGWSQGELPPVHNRREWSVYWKKTRYSNQKAKSMLHWSPRVPMSIGLSRYFEFCRDAQRNA
jgi:nucleoside-diphosphate-sugar epimerase